jgi:DNA polymerase I
MSLSSLKGKLIAFDTETTGLNPWRSRIYKKHGMAPARPFAFAFCDSEGNTAFIRWEVNPKNRAIVPVKKDIKAMSEILGDPSIVKIGHNLAFDIRMARLSGIKFDWTKIQDTSILAHTLMGGVSGVFGFQLKPLCKEYFGFEDGDEKDLLESVRKARLAAKAEGWAISNKETHGEKYIKSDYWLGDRKLLEKYARQDTERTMLLYRGLIEQTKHLPGAFKVYSETEIPLLKAVYKMERTGIRAYPEKTESLRKFYENYVNSWRLKADKLGGKNLNLNSPKQLVEAFQKAGAKLTKKTVNGNLSLDADELLKLSSTFPLAKAVLECKAGQSMISKFLNAYDRLRTDGNPSIIRTSFHQTGTRTGRFSSSDPNFQQLASPDSVKKKADIPLKPREAFGPRDDCFWYMPDYSQMEVWVFAFAAKDPILTKALLAGKDVHEEVGKRIWGHLPDWKPGKTIYRKKGKTIMFLKQYGGGASAYMNFTGCSKSEAYEALDNFDLKFPGVNEFILKITEEVQEKGWIENVFGRVSSVEKSMAYTGVNYLIQGTCADIMKRAMVRVSKRFSRKYHNEAKLLLTVHDELAIEAPKRLLKSALGRDIISDMQTDSKQIGLPVPLPVAMKLTETTWAEAKEIQI